MSASLERSLCRQSSARSSYVTFKSRCHQLEEDLRRAEELRLKAEADLMAALMAKCRKAF